MNFLNTEEVLQAAVVAAAAHAGQRRKYSEVPYVCHPLRVAHAAAHHGFTTDVVVAAILHDVLEDTDMHLRDLQQLFSLHAVSLVCKLTKTWKDTDRETVKAELRSVYYRLIAADPEAAALKVLDNTDNLRELLGLVNSQPKWAQKYVEKSLRYITPLTSVLHPGVLINDYKDALNALQARLRETTATTRTPASSGG